jgi:carbamoyltransferase
MIILDLNAFRADSSAAFLKDGKLIAAVRLVPDRGFELNLEFFQHHREDIPDQWLNGSHEFGDLFSPALENLLGPRRAPRDQLEGRHNDIARSAQAMYEEASFASSRIRNDALD